MAFKDTLRRGMTRATEPQVLFPLIALVLLAATWGMAFSEIEVDTAAAEQAAAVSSRELLSTYEAQVVRALREIDLTLTLVKHWPKSAGGRYRLEELKTKGLLPPDLLFVVSIAGRDGVIVESTRAARVKQRALDPDTFQQIQASDNLIIDRLPRGPTGEGKLNFSRRLIAANGTFDGVVTVAIDANYFVSGYDITRLGKRGVLGLLGADGEFRVRRTGDATFSGDVVDYATAVSGDDDTPATISRSSWDGEQRWTSARELYGFPLAVLVGLSVDEQLAAVHAQAGLTGFGLAQPVSRL
ncbi:MAG: hypothetical protein WDM77_11460 [Steroidobacteraceae bacterium]